MAVYRKSWAQSITAQRRVSNSLTYIILIVISVAPLIPFFWMLSTAFKTPQAIYRLPIEWIPNPPTMRNFIILFTESPFVIFIYNSVLLAAGRVGGQVFSAAFVAYGFARLRSRFRNLFFIILLSTIMLPPVVTMIPTYMIFFKLGWLNSFKPLIVPSFLGGGAFFIFLLRQFFMTLPMELDESARIDGCSYFGIFWRIILPLSKPALATIAIFAFTASWEDYIGPLIYLESWRKFPIALGLLFFRGYGVVQWGPLMAGSLIAMVPPLVLFFSAQKLFVQGVVFSGIKG